MKTVFVDVDTQIDFLFPAGALYVPGAERLLPEWERISGESVIGGGSTPDQTIPTTLVVAATHAVADAERNLRTNDPPVIARIAQDRLLIDLRTVFPEEEEALRQALLQLSAERR